MNMHGPQNVMAETELKHLASTVSQIITPASNSPIIGMYQDSLLGAFRFTREKIDLTPRQAMNLLMAYKNIDVDALLALEDKITNFDILSQIMPHITMTVKNKLIGENEDFATSNNVMEIRDGKYIRGQMEKSVLGATTNGIIHRAFNDFGPDRAAEFIDDLQAVVTEYMKTSSYSVGISDLLADNTTMTQITSTIATQKMEAKKLMDSVHLGIFKNETAYSNAAEFENQITNIMKKADNDAGKIGSKSLSKNNRFLMIVNSGSKGNMINISQMISCLGQQAVEGKRIPYGLDSRTLPHYFKYDDSPGARGYIENSYISGLTAPELFFHAMGGRIGLIDTAVKSVSWETPIVLIDNGRPLYTEIGRWIDGIIDVSQTVKKYDEKNMELVDIPNGTVFVPTMNEHGEVTWEEITAVTRHDPGNVLYQIKSLGGREVIVTESKSLLIWNKEKGIFEEILTPDIRVGDCLPVTMDLCEPPVVLDEIDVSAYLPKNMYVYGTDFNQATLMMNAAMGGRGKIPAGWWNEHNGKEFELPYTKKASLQRVNVRSNTDVIADGYIYPYHAQRIDSKMPEKFKLNYENGQFIGLFLADGHAYKTVVYITKNNENVQTFVKSWFDKHSISYEVRENSNDYGKSTSICGHSGVLASLLNGLVGKGAADKHVPTESFVANIDFVKGLLSGYFSGDGTVGKNSVEACSSSKRLIEGISMLCSRIGVFCKVFMTQLKSNNFGTKNIRPSHRISIRANWGKAFAENITLIENNKQAKLIAIRWGDAHVNFAHHNNVVLDPIVSITPLSPEKYPKMYDLTIPTTLNFGIANGLQVRDTSSTGYIQRRLIKGLEDLKVEYDMTVRNSNGKIIQFAYGDDGFDSTKVENQQIPLVGMSVEDVYMMYDIARITDKERGSKDIYTPAIVNKIRGEVEETRKMCRQYIDRMLDDREELVKNVFKYKDDAGVRLPVAFKHIINNVVGSMGLDAHSMVDISPLETFILVEEYYQKLEKLHYVRPTNLFRIMYFFYLNPRDLLCVKRYNKSALTVLLETVVLKYKQAIVNPGDMVGVIAGQSIGEPTTQLTLNSFVYETELLVRNSKGEIKCVQIGDFAKWGIDTSRKIDYMDDKDTTYAELCEFYEVPSATEEGLTVWRRIEAVTKHPVINEDGTNTMLKVTTKGQREIIATKAKSFLQLIDGKIVGVNGSELNVGDYLPVSKITYALSVSHGFIGDIYPIADIESNIIPNIINGETIMQARDGRCSDLEFDQIISIEEVPNTTPYAYDLTVEDTRNFDCMNGLCCLDTFHLSGVASKSNVTRGVPRIEEILNLTKSQKSTSLTVHLKQVDEQHMDRAVKYAKMLEHTKLSNVVKSMQICFDPSEEDTRIADDREFMRQFMEFEGMMQECGAEKNAAEKSKWVLRMEMDEETMLDKNITMDDVHFALKNSALGEDITCSYSDYNSDKLVFRIRSSTFGQSKKKNKNAPVSLDLSDDISMLRSYQDTILNSVMLRGVTGIVNVLPRKLQNMVDKEDGKYIRKDMWVLDTTGTNLLDTLALDYIDPYRTYSNDIKEVFRVLGIDAARQTIFDEMTDVMETSDVYINYHHLSLLCDRMTLTKGMVSIYRTGILSDDVGPIAKSTFEVHTKVLLDAARRAEFDHIRGVSANVMCGQQGFYGTNAFQVVLDMKEMAKLEDTLVDEGTDDVDKMMAEMGLGAADGCVSKIANNIRYLNKEKTGECKDDYDMGF